MKSDTLSTTSESLLTSFRFGVLLVASLSLYACGGGGSDAPPVATVVPPVVATEVAQTVKTRALDGVDIQVTPFAMSNATTTMPTRLEIKLSDPLVVASLAAATGKDFETATTLTTSQLPSGAWSVTWPSNVASDAGLLVTVTLKNGDVLESGLTDFQFK